MEALPLRMRQHNENAAKVAHFLRDHLALINVSWAGFSNSPRYDLAKNIWLLALNQYSPLKLKTVTTWDKN